MVLAIVLAAGTWGWAQDLSTDVYPSEDELLEALRRGDIDQERYLILLEILREGIDSSTVHLFDEIPGSDGRQTAQSRLASEQAEAFAGRGLPMRRYGEIQYRYARELDDTERGSYRTRIHLFPIEHIDLSLAFDRSVSGRERLVGRSVRYAVNRGLVREVTVGSFSRRLGLGTVLGYRGRILDCTDRLDGESALYPDYGGQNGTYVRLAEGQYLVQGIGSLHRDSANGLMTVAGMVERKLGRARVAAIVGLNRLKNRTTAETLTDAKIGALAAGRYRNGEAAIEMTAQAGARAGIAGVVAEGTHRMEGPQVKYAGWWYSPRYLDLAGGSRTGALSTGDSLGEVGFYWRTKRTGSAGGMMRTTMPLGAGVQLEAAGLFSAFGKDTSRAEVLAAVTRELGKHGQIRGDMQARLTRRADGSADDEDITRRVRIEGRWDDQRLAVRGYVGHTISDGSHDYWTVFARVRCGTARLGKFELWMNLGRIAMDRGQLDYTYGYVRCAQSLRTGTEAALKIAHRYSRNSNERHTTTVAVEVRVDL